MKLLNAIQVRPPFAGQSEEISIPEGEIVSVISDDGVIARITWNGSDYTVDSVAFGNFAYRTT